MPACTGWTLSATAPRSSWRSTSRATGWWTCGLTLATIRNRSASASTSGSMSSIVCHPVAFGEYSQNSRTRSTPAAANSPETFSGIAAPSLS